MYKIYGETHKGMVRNANEDCFGFKQVDDFCYAYVCDGMGGVEGGSIASNIASKVFAKSLTQSYRANISEKSIYMAMESSLANANQNIYDYATANPNLAGMGTTVCLAIINQNICYLANVGDSRVYLLRDNVLKQLTVDHTKVQMLLQSGQITEHQARNHPQGHLLTKAVGPDPQLSPDFFQVDVMPNDAFLLCSDGLYNMLTDQQLCSLTAQVQQGKPCEILIEAANQAGGRDNITAVVICTQGGL